MTKNELDKNGIKILEHDVSAGFIYLGTNAVYLYNNRIFIDIYTGLESTITDLGDRNTFFKSYHDYLMLSDLTEEGANTLTDWEIHSFKDYE